MKLTQTAIPDVVLIEPTVFTDERGWFMESFNEQCFHQELTKLDLPVSRPLCRTIIPAQARVYYVDYTINQRHMHRVSWCV